LSNQAGLARETNPVAFVLSASGCFGHSFLQQSWLRIPILLSLLGLLQERLATRAAIITEFVRPVERFSASASARPSLASAGVSFGRAIYRVRWLWLTQALSWTAAWLELSAQSLIQVRMRRLLQFTIRRHGRGPARVRPVAPEYSHRQLRPHPRRTPEPVRLRHHWPRRFRQRLKSRLSCPAPTRCPETTRVVVNIPAFRLDVFPRRHTDQFRTGLASAIRKFPLPTGFPQSAVDYL